MPDSGSVVLGPKLGELVYCDIGGNITNSLRTLLRALDALVQGSVLSAAIATPPGSPANGDAYIVAASPTGAWAGQAGNIAVWSTQIATTDTNTKVPAWEFHAPKAGWLVWNAATSSFYLFNGTAWAAFSAGGGTNYQTVQQAGSSKPAEAKLNVLAPITATDNSGNGSTDIAVPNMVGDTGSGGTAGLVPAAPAGSAAAGKFLKADATFAVPPTIPPNLTTQTTSYTALAADFAILMNSASATTVTLQTSNYSAKQQFRIKNISTGVVTISPSTGTIDGNASIFLSQYQSVDIEFDGTNYWLS